MTMPARPRTRVGHIAYGRNRFCGADVFAELAAEIASPSDLLTRAFGARPLDDDDREALRCAALALTSPDARVWPLKLTRLLACHGSAFAGFYGAQLAGGTELMGPGTGTNAARALAWILDQVGDAVDDPVIVARTYAVYLAHAGRIAGFGVPFRPEDERRVELTRLLAGHPITARRAWRLQRCLGEVGRTASGIAPNVVLPLAAIALDLQIAPARVGLFMSLTMAPTFAAHALEACDADGDVLRVLPLAALDYRGPAPRQSAAAAAAG